jgi:uncharacterized protein (UPF0179 family)
MPLVTLVGEKLAKPGKELVFCGMIKECKTCKLKSACLNLEEGRRYKIRNVRDSRHDCSIHEGGVRAVEIEKIPTSAAVGQRDAIEGAIVKFVPLNCKNLDCQFHKICHPLGLKDGMKGKIVGVAGQVECPRGHELITVKLL